MDPIATPSTFDPAPIRVIGAVLVAVAAVVVAAGLRRLLMASGDEFKRMWLDVSTWFARAVLRRRPAMPASPWFCAACHSGNTVAASRCYRCGAARADAEAPALDAEAPTAPSGGGTRRRG